MPRQATAEAVDTATQAESQPELLTLLDALSDGELRQTIARAEKLLYERDQQRKEEAKERARQILAEAGLLFPEDLARNRKKGAK